MPDDPGLSEGIRGHEFDAEERTGQHRLVAASMLVVIVAVAIRQAWYKQVEGFVFDKTHGTTGTASSTTNEGQKAIIWLMGIGGTWLVLSLMVDLGDTAPLAVALALVIMGSVLLEYGPDVFNELGINVQNITAPPIQLAQQPSKRA